MKLSDSSDIEQDGGAAAEQDDLPQILLVDDEPMVLSSYCRMLRSQRLKIHTAQSAEEGLRILCRNPVQVVLTDLCMSGMNGLEFMGLIRRSWPETLRILVSAHADARVLEQAIQEGGIFRYLGKPCDPSKLQKTVTEALDHLDRQRRTRQTLRLQKLSLQTFQSIFHTATDPMVVANLDGRLLEVNAAFLTSAVGGHRADTVEGHTLLGDWQGGERWPEIQKLVLGEGYWSEVLHHRQQQVWAQIQITLVNDDDGSPYALAAVIRDVTDTQLLQKHSRQAQIEVLMAIAHLAEFRDPETGSHLDRMRHYCRLLARHMARSGRYDGTIGEEFIEALYATSPLHDVGKVGIPDTVLLKPGKLTEDEWKVMKLHTLIGGEVLSLAGRRLQNTSWLEMARTIAMQHHEKFNGSGYPIGRKGFEIDLTARIVALADAYDAITSRRTYKEALPHEQAISLIQKDSGTHFDPDVVEAFLTIKEQFQEIKKKYTESEIVQGEAIENRHNPSGMVRSINSLLSGSSRSMLYEDE